MVLAPDQVLLRPTIDIITLRAGASPDGARGASSANPDRVR